jgi:GxxExxY protein
LGDLPHQGITSDILGAAFDVHRALGPGFIEKVYEKALIHELQDRGLNVRSQVDVPIYYRGVAVHSHRLDLLVESLVVVEIKAIDALADIHDAILLSYLKATNLEVGLLLNFATMSLTYRRRVRSSRIP